MKKPRGNCETCGTTFVLLASGNVPTHQDPSNKRNLCKGSNLAPEPS